MRFPEYGREPRLIIPQSCGGYSEGETPGPIPNPEVKPLSADGTAREASWESRTPPHISSEKADPHQGRLSLFSRSFSSQRPSGQISGGHATSHLAGQVRVWAGKSEPEMRTWHTRSGSSAVMIGVWELMVSLWYPAGSSKVRTNAVHASFTDLALLADQIGI
jgi:hypothetical protein